MSEENDFDNRAVFEAERAVEKSPADPRAHAALAGILLDAGRIEEALVSVMDSLRLDPGNADTSGLLSKIYLEKREWSKALDAAFTGIGLDPTHEACIESRSAA